LQRGLVVQKLRFLFFLTRIHFLGHYIFQGTITPIKRSLTFASKFPNKILDKNLLQRFSGSLNYVLDLYPNIFHLAKPLHDRLGKNHVPWYDEHFSIVKKIKKNRYKKYLAYT
jgi:hypothetical protein